MRTSSRKRPLINEKRVKMVGTSQRPYAVMRFNNMHGNFGDVLIFHCLAEQLAEVVDRARAAVRDGITRMLAGST